MERKVLYIARCEWPALAASLGFAFLLLTSYYILRPVRDEMAVRAGTGNLPWLFSGTFVVTLLMLPVLAWTVGRVDRVRLFFLMYGFFALSLSGFYVALTVEWKLALVGPLFFMWLSAFNVIAISTMWSLLDEIFSEEQAKRLFGYIAAGASSGAVAGPAITALFVKMTGVPALMLVSAVLLMAGAFLVLLLSKLMQTSSDHPQRVRLEEPVEGRWWDGFKLTFASPNLVLLSLALVFFSFTGTVLYFEQTSALRSAFQDTESRTRALAQIDLAVNVFTLGIELFVSRALFLRMRPGALLAAFSGVNLAGFVAIGMAGATLAPIAAFQVARRSLEYSTVRPAREIFFTSLTRIEKYKAKNFIDAAVFRGADVLSAWVLAALALSGTSLAWFAAAVGTISAMVCWRIGRRLQTTDLPLMRQGAENV